MRWAGFPGSCGEIVSNSSSTWSCVITSNGRSPTIGRPARAEPDARRRASAEFGGLDQVKELCRDARGTRWIEDLAQDIRYGMRVFWRNPSFTITAVLSLALGIGANTAIFTLVDAAMLKPLPVREPGRLVELLTNSSNARPGDGSNAFSYQALVYSQIARDDG